MKSIKRCFFFYIFLCAVFFCGSAAGQNPENAPNTETSPVKTPVSEENLIHAGDLIDVDVVGSTEYDWRGTLNPEGFLNGINFTENPVFALCQTEESVAAKIAASYAKILRNPTVAVRILDRSKRPVSVLYGAVKKNQRFQINRPVSLSELIIVSGGFTDKVSGEIQILRPPNANCLNQGAKEIESGNDKTGEKDGKFILTAAGRTAETQYINIKISDLLSGNREANPRIFGGDIITVAEAKPVYIIGGVAAPKRIAVRSQITLSRAVDSAGGLAKGADARQITIFRRNGAETKTILADLDKIKSGQVEDVVLQPFDVVEVAQNGRAKSKFPPVINAREANEKQSEKLPLKIID